MSQLFSCFDFFLLLKYHIREIKIRIISPTKITSNAHYFLKSKIYTNLKQYPIQAHGIPVICIFSLLQYTRGLHCDILLFIKLILKPKPSLESYL